ncbi:unnamed protein product [Effrenium voratum]|uniref:Uncharacterized protein n=1 Tax=Effrenium voratum TaxID=2562239 RepID=A0AA36N5H3_9DINO|nr:unnamed protein product [Effrenium voratum]
MIGFACCFIFLLPLVAGLCWYFVWSAAPVGQSDIGRPVPLVVPDCVTGYSDWKNQWSDEVRSYCCQHYHRACAPHIEYKPKVVVHDVRVPVQVPLDQPVPVPVTYHKTVYVKAPPPYQCALSEHLDVEKWSAQHQRYCCYEKGITCKPVIVNKDVYHTVHKVKNVYVPHYIPAPAPHTKVTYKEIPYPVPDSPKVIPMPVPGHTIVKHTFQVKPKFIKVPVPGKTEIIRKPVPVPVPSKPIYQYFHEHHEHHDHHEHDTDYDCDAGYKNWYFGWSGVKKAFCCDHFNKGCPGSWHGEFHLHTHVEEGMGHATGKIYDCEAGFFNWQQGWSDSKKNWCCDHTQKGCEKFHCSGASRAWGAARQDWCCSHYQAGCPQTTLSPLGCDAVCTYKGESSSCKDRISWTTDHVFSGHGNACALAYSRIQVECDVCRACSVEAAGCQVHAAASEPFDCQAAFNNFVRAWSPQKKVWCCNVKKMGCEGANAPTVDAGFGMVWKHVQVNGAWVWMAVKGDGVASLPYDCHAGLAHHFTGWSAGKKSWCCTNQHLGCGAGGAGAGGAGGGGASGGGSWGGGASGGGSWGGGASGGSSSMPPGIANAGMMWQHTNSGGHWHWVQVHSSGHLDFDCVAGYQNWHDGWHWCCSHFGKACQ